MEPVERERRKKGKKGGREKRWEAGMNRQTDKIKDMLRRLLWK